LCFVPQEQIGKAKEFIDRYERGEIKDASQQAGTYCFHCGGECNATDAVCPSCGNSLDAADDIDGEVLEGQHGISGGKSAGEAPMDFLRRIKWPLAVVALLVVTAPIWMGSVFRWLELLARLFQ
jgi:hypothetical protein